MRLDRSLCIICTFILTDIQNEGDDDGTDPIAHD